MAATVLGALVELFDGDAVLTDDFAGAGGLWVGGVPEDRLALPQCVLLDYDQVPDQFWPNVRTERATFRFVVYAAELAAAEALAADLLGLYDPRAEPRAPQQPPRQLVLL